MILLIVDKKVKKSIGTLQYISSIVVSPSKNEKIVVSPPKIVMLRYLIWSDSVPLEGYMKEKRLA